MTPVRHDPVPAAGRFPHDVREGTSDGRPMACRHQDGTALVVLQRRCHYSAFAGYRWTPSAYSTVRCLPELDGCGSTTRTRAAYVDQLPDAPETS